MHGDKIGTFRSRHLVGTLPAVPVYEMHDVYATTTASFSEANLWLIVEHGVHITEGGLYRLPEDHQYRLPEFGQLTIERGLSNSADIMRKVMDMAQQWRGICKLDCPVGTVGEGAPDGVVSKTLDAVREEYRKQGATIDEDGVIIVQLEKQPRENHEA